MPKRRDETMLRVDPLQFALAIGRAELEPVELAQKAGVSPNAVYSAARGYLIKPLKLGKMARAMGVPLEELIVSAAGKAGSE